MTDAERLAEIRKSIEDGETIETEETVWEFCEIAERALSELAEAKEELAISKLNYRQAEKERGAALARVKELEYWRNGSWAMKALDKARAEAEALRAALIEHHPLRGGRCTICDLPDTPARLSPPAPAPTTIHDVLQARLERLRDKPAPETGKCTCPPNSLDVLCPLPIKDHGAPAPCEHSWVEEEDEANLPQTACENCGATKPAPGGRER